MNPKIERLDKEIEKTKEKIETLRLRLTSLEAQKVEAENSEILAIVHSLSLTPSELREFLENPYPTSPKKEAMQEIDQEDPSFKNEEGFYGEA